MAPARKPARWAAGVAPAPRETAGDAVIHVLPWGLIALRQRGDDLLIAAGTDRDELSEAVQMSAAAIIAEAEAHALTADRDETEVAELRTALGEGGTGKGAAGAAHGTSAIIQELEKKQKSRKTRASRDALDRALIDLGNYFRDAMMLSAGAGAVAASHPDMSQRTAALAEHASADRLLRCIEAVLACREALAANVKPKFAVDALVATVGRQLSAGG
jgi:DNA polymerase-3 subunit delta'